MFGKLKLIREQFLSARPVPSPLASLAHRAGAVGAATLGWRGA